MTLPQLAPRSRVAPEERSTAPAAPSPWERLAIEVSPVAEDLAASEPGISALLRLAAADLARNADRASSAVDAVSAERSWSRCVVAEGALAAALHEARRRRRISSATNRAVVVALSAVRRHRLAFTAAIARDLPNLSPINLTR